MEFIEPTLRKYEHLKRRIPVYGGRDDLRPYPDTYGAPRQVNDRSLRHRVSFEDLRQSPQPRHNAIFPKSGVCLFLSGRRTPETTLKTTLKTTLREVLSIIKDNPEVSIPELAAQLNLSREGIKYNIKKLKDLGYIRREGAKKGGRWIVLKDR